ncbi:MAG TPA: hypothetical protein VD973_14105 [Symbiobacteriaceae bacterium]|nr:hypothetical protein [Symbiobacteriaceae bacterium]
MPFPDISPAAPVETGLNLGAGASSVPALLLRANIPSTVTLTGPSDLFFSALTLTVIALPLVRNMAGAEWGTTRSTLADAEELLLPAHARMLGAGIRQSDLASLTVKAKDAGQFVDVVPALTLSGDTNGHEGYQARAFVTDTVRFMGAKADEELWLPSASLPARVAVAVGEDTPIQVFPSEMAANETVTTRELAGALNAAWRRSATGNAASVKVRLTSMTDALVRLDLNGTWGRSYLSPVAELKLDPFNEAAAALPWSGFDGGSVTLRLVTELTGGRLLGLPGGAPTFTVQCTDKLEVAQAFRIDAGSAPGRVRKLAAVWLQVPAVPKSPATLELRLAEATGAPAVPADDSLCRLEVTLPADASAYVAAGGAWWYRAPLARPFALDGSMVKRPLFLVAVGQGQGQPLCHQSELPLPGVRERLPVQPRQAGRALVRNWQRTGAWEEQAFNQATALWRFDLELEPLAEEYAHLVTAAVGTEAAMAVPLTGPSEQELQVGPFALHPPGETSLTVLLRSAAVGRVAVQAAGYQPVK